MINILAWLGSGLQILGAIALASRITSPRVAYWMMLPGALIYVGVAVAGHDWSLFAMQITFAVINAIGIARWRG